MSKAQKVITVGNSFAVTINRKALRLLRIDHTTELSVSVEDRDTILIRPTRRSDRTGQPSSVEMYRMMKTLIQRHDMTATQFNRLSHDGTSWQTFLISIDVGGVLDLTTVARLATCLQLRSDAQRRRESVPWDTTIDTVLEMIPDRSPTTEPAQEPSSDQTFTFAGVSLSQP